MELNGLGSCAKSSTSRSFFLLFFIFFLFLINNTKCLKILNGISLNHNSK